MKYITSCGFVTYKQANGRNSYLIIRSLNGDVGFPKGHVEAGESEIETALRELKEETNVDVEVIPGFRCQIEYEIPNSDGVIKRAVYFLGKCISDNVACQETEVTNAVFLPYEEAKKELTFNETKQILEKAEIFIEK